MPANEIKAETIRGVQFSVYKGPREIDVETPKFSGGFYIAVTISVIYFALLLNLGSKAILSGNATIADIFASPFLLGPYLLLLGAVIWTRRKKQRDFELPPRPAGVPREALFAACRIYWSTQTSLTTRGWIYLHDSGLVFMGERFCWRLNANDVVISKSQGLDLRRLRLPKGFPRGFITVIAGDRDALSELVGKWREETPLGSVSVFPPIDLPLKKVDVGGMWGRLFAFAAVFALMIGLVVAASPIDSYRQRPEMPYVVGLAVFAMFMSFPLLLTSSTGTYKSHAKLVEKLRQGS